MALINIDDFVFEIWIYITLDLAQKNRIYGYLFLFFILHIYRFIKFWETPFHDFENLTIELHVSYILNTYVNFHTNQMLFTIQFINFFFFFCIIL